MYILKSILYPNEVNDDKNASNIDDDIMKKIIVKQMDMIQMIQYLMIRRIQWFMHNNNNNSKKVAAAIIILVLTMQIC